MIFLPSGDLTVPSPFRARKHLEYTKDDIAQLEITVDDKGKLFAKDPWADEAWSSAADHREQEDRLLQQPHHKLLIIGAGHGGLLFAVRLLQTGVFMANDLLIVDKAAGFGGTWYWNRYPGLMCDTESYIYMPLLAETGYMPREKYASGAELRAHSERIADTWGLRKRALLQTTVQALDWDATQGQWKATVTRDGSDQVNHITSAFTILPTGFFASPRIPEFPGLWNYKGPMFHPARWDYAVTGGTPETPKMDRLRDKTVAIVGTGASAVQIIPQLAQYSKRVLVFQRTPASVDRRDNRSTERSWWEGLTASKGWQRKRMENFNAFIGDPKLTPQTNMVADGWTNMPSYSIIVGAEGIAKPQYSTRMEENDQERRRRIQKRIHGIVQDIATANTLTPEYPGWCRRPCFHDYYLPAFNKANVKLIDLQKEGSLYFTESGIVAGGAEYQADLIVLSTGFTTPLTRGTPASRANIKVRGRDGATMDTKWERGLATLHGIMTRDFPNMFFSGPAQSGVCVNQTYTLDQIASHVAYIVSTATKQAGDLRIVIEPTADAEEGWAEQVVTRAGGSLGALAACTSGSFARKPVVTEEQKKGMARLATWREGIASYVAELERWRADGGLPGLEITVQERGSSL
ncbi:hypothetical protein BDV06DRAFT_230227 [Aspergillus oleicola]